MQDRTSLAQLAADIIASYVENNAVPRSELPELIGRVFDALAGVSESPPEQASEQAPQKPAVSIRRSVTEEHIVCLEDGLKFKSLKRHLGAAHGLSPDQYRQRWKLPRDYPMTAPKYAQSRSELAQRIGLGTKRRRNRKAKG